MTPLARLHATPLLHGLLQTQRPDVPWRVALRNTAAVVSPLAIGMLAGHLAIGLAVSAGALNTMFADQPGPYRLRLRRMLLTALAAGVAAFAGSLLGAWPDALLIVVALWGFVAALLVAVGPHATRAGLVSLILLVVLGAEPLPAAQALPAALLFVAGGVLQTLFAVAAWPLQRYRPERLALAEALRGIAGVAREAIAHGTSPPLPPSLNELQLLLYGSGRARGRAAEAFRVLAELAERIRIELLALADLQSACTSPPLRDALHATRQSAATLLELLANALEQAVPPALDAALTHYDAAAGMLEDIATEHAEGTRPRDRWQAQIAFARAAALGGQLRAAARNADAAGSRGELRAQAAETRLPRALRAGNPLAILRANLHLSSAACRHALRSGVCIAIALALSHVLPLSRGYWMPMTVAIVLKPDFGATWRFGLLRVAGTLAGLVLTTALLHFGLVDFWSTLALLAVLCFAYRELATVHYGIAVACLTGLVVILLSYYGVAPGASMAARATDTALGSVLALVAYLLWPTWERGRERAALAAMLDAYRDYFLAATRGDARERREARTAARTRRSNAQASLERLRHEPAGARRLPRAETLVANANRFLRAAMALEAARSDADNAALPARFLDFAAECADALKEIAQALREARAARSTVDLRAMQLALAKALPDETVIPPALTAALLDTGDRMTDAIDTLAHVLAQPGAVQDGYGAPPG